jgi:Asp-tRNA(Asn)/Glu-tRNA(Gln) amidotransferase A subunit family amidase
MSDDLMNLDADAQADLVRRGDLQPLALVDAAIARIERLNPSSTPSSPHCLRRLARRRPRRV